MHLILGKNGRGDAVWLGTESDQTKANDLARQIALAGKVSEVAVVSTVVLFNATAIARENPDQDTSRAEAESADNAGGASAQGLNAAKHTAAEGESQSTDKPKVNLAQAEGKAPAPKDAAKPSK